MIIQIYDFIFLLGVFTKKKKNFSSGPIFQKEFAPKNLFKMDFTVFFFYVKVYILRHIATCVTEKKKMKAKGGRRRKKK